ncbi:glycosyltransferase [Prosthecobacter sp.]|uniref:glycosyltransferase n=1 Tax=Prosthecobacter sp. TaxID=1965333 RepID=UPI0037851757
MKHILLLPHGTAGDVFPQIWVGRQMLRRGHKVTMIWTEAFRETALKAGLDFVALKDEGYEEMIRNPALWKPHESLKLTYSFAGRSIGPYVHAVMEAAGRHGMPDLMLAPIMAFAAPLLRAKLGVPLITTHIATLQLMSAHEVPLSVPAARLLRRLPLLLRKTFLKLVAPYDHLAFSQVRSGCRTHGIRPPRRLRDWWHSPDGGLALFPEWYAGPQPDWPAHTLQWDFPLEDVADEKPLGPELSAFLDAGEKPVVFTLGSFHLHSRRYFEVAARIAAELGCRAVFATREVSQAPAALTPSVFVTSYAPFSALLPRARAFVHHGGIGTTSQCFAAGLPQLITPLAYDQPDNAACVERLGAGLQLDIGQFTVKRALPLLRRCLTDGGIRQQAAACAARMRQRPDADKLAAWLEARCLNSSPSPA